MEWQSILLFFGIVGANAAVSVFLWNNTKTDISSMNSKIDSTNGKIDQLKDELYRELISINRVIGRHEEKLNNAA